MCVGITVATELALRHYLVGELDAQLLQIAQRSAVMERRPPPLPGMPPPPPPPPARPGPGPEFLDAPGQPVGMVAAIIRDGAPVKAGTLNRSGDRDPLSVAAGRELSALNASHPVSRDLDGLGRYRLITMPGRQPNTTLVVGLSMRNINQTLARVALIFTVLTALALVIAVVAGLLIIRRALAPLNRVVATAGEVAGLRLDQGEDALAVRVPDADATPRTEVGRLGLAINRMLDHIAAALSARQASESRVRQFVADASHELRTPLAAIRGYAELARRRNTEVPPDVAHALHRVESEGTRMTNLVDDLLLLARLDSGRPLEHQQVDLTRLCADIISDAHAAGPDHHWNLDVPDEPVTVVGDEARLHQVIANLLANARVHTPSGTTVTLSLNVSGNAAVLRVRDNGPGIPAELQPEVFERFVRADTGRSHADGSTGLGLAIVSAVVRAHAGGIMLDSVPGCTEFTVRLPRAETMQSPSPRAAETA